MQTYSKFAITFASAIVSLGSPLCSSLGAQNTRDITPYLMADRAAEIALARTAAPASTSSEASVLVLTRTGYTEAAHGTNGFTCVVMRSFSAAPSDPEFWNSHVRAPHCFNPPAARTVLPTLLAQISWALAGATPAQLDAKMRKAYVAGAYPVPAAGAMAYMLSPKQYLNDIVRRWMPHVMFYYDHSITGSTFGTGGHVSPVIDATGGDKSQPFQVIYIPIAIWSDGTPAMPASSGK